MKWRRFEIRCPGDHVQEKEQLNKKLKALAVKYTQDQKKWEKEKEELDTERTRLTCIHED